MAIKHRRVGRLSRDVLFGNEEVSFQPCRPRGGGQLMTSSAPASLNELGSAFDPCAIQTVAAATLHPITEESVISDLNP